MQSVFVLEHLHVHENGEECWKRIGIYKAYQDAVDAMVRTRILPGFCDYPDLMDETKELTSGFLIEEYQLNLDHWQSGFVTE
jgi:hypothetical protein